jgi:hypothetical protein
MCWAFMCWSRLRTAVYALRRLCIEPTYVLGRLWTEPLPYVLSPYVMNRLCVEPAYVLVAYVLSRPLMC